MLTAVLLLSTALTTHNPLISTEIISSPIRQALPAEITGPSVAVTHVANGYVVAWSGAEAGGASRIFVARLDANGIAVPGAVSEIAINNPSGVADAYLPALASDGDRVLLGWLERSPLGQYRAIVAPLDAHLISGKPIVETLVSNPVHVAIRGGITYVSLDDWLMTYDAIGNLLGSTHLALAPDGIAPSGGPAYYTGHVFQPAQGQICNIGHGWQCQPAHPDVYNLYLGEETLMPFVQALPWKSAHRTAIAFDGTSGLLVWYDGSFDRGGNVAAARFASPRLPIDDPTHPIVLGTFLPSYLAAAPSVAWDGTRYVVVWQVQESQAKFDLKAVTVSTDGTVTPIDFPASDFNEINPTVIAVAPGQFLIAYEMHGADVRIGGRFLNFNGKPHAGGR